MITTVHAWIRTDDEGFEHLTFLDTSIEDAVKEIGDEKIIAIFDESMVVEGEFTYEQPSRPFNKTIWWYRPRDKADPNSQIVSDAMDVDEFLAHLDTLGEE
jgi:hypothetical protein